MDLMSGLAAASQAIQIAKDLRSIDRTVDEAAFKLPIAELTEKLADTKMALSAAKELTANRDARIRALEQHADDALKGDICPACGTGRLRKTGRKTPRMDAMASVGIQEWEMTCESSDCGHKETKLHDPNRILNK